MVAAAVLSFGQTATKEAAPATKKATAPAAKPDTWQRSKECAAQADKVWNRKDGLLVDYEKSVRDVAAVLTVAQELEAAAAAAKSGKVTPAVPITVEKGFVNHYSPKYGMCFLKATFRLGNVGPGAGKHLDRTSSILLINAVEGGLVATYDFSLCYLGGKHADCAEAKSMIDDAMSN